MAKTNLETIPFGTYAAGPYQLPVVNAGQTATQFEIAITRTALPNTPAVVATIAIEGSDDGGTTWVGLGGGALTGGDAIARDGSVATESIYAVRFDNSKPGSYKLRGTVILLQTLTTGARLTVS